MAKVICTLPNASNLINGVKFVEHELGMISEEIEDEVAGAFAAIKGYVLANTSGKPAGKPGRPSSKKVDAGSDASNPADQGSTQASNPQAAPDATTDAAKAADAAVADSAGAPKQ